MSYEEAAKLIEDRPELQAKITTVIPDSNSAKIRRESENKKCAGGMRHPRHAVARSHKLREFGKRARNLISSFLDKFPDLQKNVLNAIGSKDKNASIEGELLDKLRGELAKEFGADDHDPVKGICSTLLRPSLIAACVKAADDPEIDLEGWLREGAPIGVSTEIPSRGIFPEVDLTGKPTDDLPCIFTALDGFSNYNSVEDDREVAEPEIMREVELGFAEVFTLSQIKEMFGDNVVASPLGLVKKWKRDGSLKLRIVNDFRRSGINAFSKMRERLVLPRMIDLIEDTLDLMEDLATKPSAEEMEATEEDAQVEFLTIDFSDAFKNIPANPNERRYQVARCFNFADDHPDFPGEPRFVVYRSLVFGNGPSPLIWGRCAALMGRLGQALFREWELRLQIYIDDPCGPVRGTRVVRDRNMTTLLVFWAALGLPIAWHKAERGQSTEWIGAEFSIASRDIPNAQLPNVTQSDRKLTIAKLRASPVIRIREVRSLAGQCSWTAGLVEHLRPFTAPLWAVTSPNRSRDLMGPTKGTVWTKAIDWALSWLEQWHDNDKLGDILKSSRSWKDRHSIPSTAIVTDASPWGIGGVLFKDNLPIAWFAEQIDPEWEDYLSIRVGDPAGQAALELLALLAAGRLWLSAPEPGAPAPAAVIRSDSRAAIAAALKMKSSTAAMLKVAREVAMDKACKQYDFSISDWGHLPGILNVWADAISRLEHPSGKYVIPKELLRVPRIRTKVVFKCRHIPISRAALGAPPGVPISAAA